MSTELDIFHHLLALAVGNNASDIHVKTDKPAFLRISGRLEPVDMDPLTHSLILRFIEETCPGQFLDRWQEESQIDYSYRAPDIGRFRINAYHQRGTPSIVFRHVKNKPPTFADLNMEPENLVNLCQQKDGIALICGPTSSGKSSTLAAMLNWMNQNLDRHVVTLEDPIEFTFTDAKSIFSQREVGIDTPNFGTGIKSVLRQDPDVILIGEMRDAETFTTAVSAAETGHYVLSTLHAGSAQQSVQRIFEFYPPEQHLALRRQVASTLRAVITQRLVPALEGGGRWPIVEMFIVDAVARKVINDGELTKIPTLVETNKDSGCKSFNQDLFDLIKAGRINKPVGLTFSPNPKALEMNLRGIFLNSSGLLN